MDSVDEATLADRKAHLERMSTAVISAATLAQVRSLSLGRGKGWHGQKRAQQRRENIASKQAARATRIGSAGLGMHRKWELLNREELPEVVLMGHSNCGKSALLNSLSGAFARNGPAGVSARAGWTAELNFYQLRPQDLKQSQNSPAAAATGVAAANGPGGGHDPPSLVDGMVLVDTPGYGFTVGAASQLTKWGELLADYLDHSRNLSLALILVDCTRGLCDADRRVLRRVRDANVPVLVALTKADLLSPEDLAASHAVVAQQLKDEDEDFHQRRLERYEVRMRLQADARRTEARIRRLRGEAVEDQVAEPQEEAADKGAPTRKRLVRAPPLMLSSHFYAGVANLWRALLREVRAIRRQSSQDA